MTTQATMSDTEVDYAEAFHFPQGLAGFNNAHEFGFIYQGHGDITCLQSIDQPEAAFLVTPWDEARLGPVPSLPRDLCHCIEIEKQSQIMWMLVLNPFIDEDWVTANLKAPLAINPQSRIGLQCIRPDPKANIRYPWMPQPKGNE